MAFGRRGTVGAVEAGRPQSHPEASADADGVVPQAEIDESSTHVSPAWRSFAIKSAIGIALVAAFVGYNRFGDRLFAFSDGGFYAGRPTQPYRLVEGPEPQAWKFGACWLDSTQFLDGDDHNLVFNSIGRLHPETTPDALDAASQFFSCVSRKEAERLCDPASKNAFVADIGTFYKRFDTTHALITGAARSRGVNPAAMPIAIDGPLGERVMLAQANRRSKLISKFETMDGQVGRAIYFVIETGVMTPADFGSLSAQQVRQHLNGLIARPSACK